MIAVLKTIALEGGSERRQIGVMKGVVLRSQDFLKQYYKLKKFFPSWPLNHRSKLSTETGVMVWW